MPLREHRASTRLPRRQAQIPATLSWCERIPLALLFAALVGGGILLVSGVCVLLARWLSPYDFSLVWSQGAAAYTACCLLVAALLVPTLQRVSRFLLASTGVVFLLVLFNLFRPAQQLFPSGVVLFWLWFALYSQVTVDIWHRHYLPQQRRYVALCLGWSAALVNLGAAVYYVVMMRYGGPASIDRYWLYGVSILVLPLLRLIGGGPSETQLSGAVAICTNCGLRNIAERRTCKRCGTLLEVDKRNI